MTELKLLKLANFGTVGEAEALKAALEMEGIPCVLSPSDATVQNLWYLGSDCGGITVQVTEGDWELAQAVLNTPGADTPYWICSVCQTNVEAGFEVCWQCGTQRPAP